MNLFNITRVVNIRKEPYDVYIGRKGHGQDGYFGNPFNVRDYERPAECMNDYVEYFMRRVTVDKEFRDRVFSIKGKTLGCFCKPGPCHGDVIVGWLEGED